MKQNRNRIIRLAMAALLLTTGCTKEAESPAGAAYSDVQILAASELAEDNVVVVPQSETRAAADPMQAMTFYLVRADEMGKGIGTYGAYSTTPLPATRVAGTGAQALAFATKQYYLASNAKTKLTGWYPAETSLTGSVVSWTINGATDILTAAEQAGNMGSPMPNLVFNHSLAQVQIHAYAPDANARDTWGTISKIELVEQPNTCTYDFSANAATGTVTPKSGTTGTFAVGNIAGATIPVVTAAQVGDPVMIAPQTAAAVLKLEVTTSKCGKVAVSMPAGVYTSGKAYILKLKFNPLTIDATASIGTWQTVDRSEQELRPSVPPPAVGDYYFTDGSYSPDLVSGKTACGIFYSVDSADPEKFKVFSLDQGSNLTWAEGAYVLGADGQSETDGKANVAAMKAYFAANTATVGTDFSLAFPAAAFCDAKNTGGVTGWHLPAKDEMVALSTAYKANQTVLSAAITASSGTPFPASGYFWSSTENSNTNYVAWYVTFSTGNTGSGGKDIDYFVRCVRKITPPPPPAIGDVKDGGIVYWVDDADPTKYKVLSLDQSTKKWAASTSYEIGSGAQSDTDGKGNSAAIKSAFDNKMAGVAITESTFEDAFPAAAYCYNYKGKDGTDPVGTWYLPAKTELQYLWCAFNGKAPAVSWVSGTNSAAPANQAAQKVFNGYLTAVGGTEIPASGYFRSSTEHSSSYSWCVNFSNGSTNFNGKDYGLSVRCVRAN